MERILGIALLLASAVLVTSMASPTQTQTRMSFQIATGSPAGTYYPIGQMLASIISNPPGVGRCQEAGRCGPPGLLAAARASEGAVANSRAVNEGRVPSALVQSDIAQMAASGEGVFAKEGPRDRLRAIANLFPEFVHVVASTESGVTRLSDLKRKRVAVDAPDSGTRATAMRIFGAVGLNARNMKLSDESAEPAARRLEEGSLDAFVFVGGPPLGVIADLIAAGKARLVPITGKAITALTTAAKALRIAQIPASFYPGAEDTPTIAVSALWVVSSDVPDTIIEAVTRALWHPANRRLLDSGHPMGRLIRPEVAMLGLPIPLHPGAERAYRELAGTADR